MAVEALQIFEWELGGAALECYSALLGPKQQLGGLGEYSSGLPGADLCVRLRSGCGVVACGDACRMFVYIEVSHRVWLGMLLFLLA